MPLLAKIGIPIAIIAMIAFMRWTNAKTTGEPFFPGVDQAGKGSNKGGAGSALTPKGEGLTTPSEVTDSGTYAEPTVNADIVGDSAGVSAHETSSGTPSGGSLHQGGYVSPQSTFGQLYPGGVSGAASAIESSSPPTLGAYSPPGTSIPTPQFGGGISGSTFAL